MRRVFITVKALLCLCIPAQSIKSWLTDGISWINHYDEGKSDCSGEPMDARGKKTKEMHGNCTDFDPRGTAFGVDLDPDKMSYSQIDLYDNRHCSGDPFATLDPNRLGPGLCVTNQAKHALPGKILGIANRTIGHTDASLRCNSKICHPADQPHEFDSDIATLSWAANFESRDCSREPIGLNAGKTYLRGKQDGNRFIQNASTIFKPNGTAFGVILHTLGPAVQLFRDDKCTDSLGIFGWGKKDGKVVDPGLCMTKESLPYPDVRCIQQTQEEKSMFYCDTEMNTCGLWPADLPNLPPPNLPPPKGQLLPNSTAR